MKVSTAIFLSSALSLIDQHHAFTLHTRAGARHSLRMFQQSPQGNSDQSSYSYQGTFHDGGSIETNKEVAGDDQEPQTANRFSAFAPDTNLSPEDFRKQLKDNMKADLEKRRQSDPNRGNQPAKSYLDSL